MKGLSFIVLVALWGIALAQPQNLESNGGIPEVTNSGIEEGK